ncbi:hypothetical protein Q9565_001392 [Salmonella enterica]|nr:hypothetical protein [Salmonella enterica]
MQHIYYLDSHVQADGSRLVHTALCGKLSGHETSQYLGIFGSCLEAVREARLRQPQAKGCVLCCQLEPDGL